jgi:hypothetical protein
MKNINFLKNINLPKNNRAVNIIVGIVLVLFASLAAPKLPRSITQYLENPILRFVIFVGIAYLATKDIITAIIAVIAVLISYQTLSVHKITDTVMDKTKVLLDNVNLQQSQQAAQQSQQAAQQSQAAAQQSQAAQQAQASQEAQNLLKKNIREFTLKAIDHNPTIKPADIANAIVVTNPEINYKLVTDIVNETLLTKSQEVSNNKKSVTFDNNTFNSNLMNDITNISDNRNINKKSTKKYLQGNSDIYLEHLDSNYHTLEAIDSKVTLTDSCSNVHKSNYQCNSPKDSLEKPDNVLSGFDEYDLNDHGEF